MSANEICEPSRNFRMASTSATTSRCDCGWTVWTRDIEVVMVSGTGLVVMVSVTETMGVSVPVSVIETWRFPSLGFCFLVLTEPPPTGTVISKSALYPTATK